MSTNKTAEKQPPSAIVARGSEASEDVMAGPPTDANVLLALAAVGGWCVAGLLFFVPTFYALALHALALVGLVSLAKTRAPLASHLPSLDRVHASVLSFRASLNAPVPEPHPKPKSERDPKNPNPNPP